MLTVGSGIRLLRELNFTGFSHEIWSLVCYTIYIIITNIHCYFLSSVNGGNKSDPFELFSYMLSKCQIHNRYLVNVLELS